MNECANGNKAMALLAAMATLDGIIRILAAGAKHGMTTEETIMSEAMLIEIGDAWEGSLCWPQYKNPISINTYNRVPCLDPECAKLGGSLIRHPNTSNYKCNREGCRKTYTKAEVMTEKCPVCGETTMLNPKGKCLVVGCVPTPPAGE